MDPDSKENMGQSGSSGGCPYLTPAQVDSIAEKAAEKAVRKVTDNFYIEIGKGVVSKIFLVFGVLGTLGYFWLREKGIL